MQARMHWLCWVMLVTILGLLMLTSSCSKERALDFTLMFKNAKGLQPGQFVVYQGLRIGTVRSVELAENGRVAVRVAIQGKYRDRVYKEAGFSIENRDGIVNASGEKQLTMKDRKLARRTPIDPDSIIEADHGWGILGEMVDRLAADGLTAATWVGEQTKRMWQASKDYATSPEGEELRASIDRLLSDGRRVSREQYQQFMDERYPEIKKNAENLKLHMEEEGLGEDAKEFWGAFLRTWEGGNGGEMGDSGKASPKTK